jgi:hypothetical protein
VTIDKWFSSPDLYSKLCSKQTDNIGTQHQNRKEMPDEIKAKLKNGESEAVYKDRWMIMKWKDKRKTFYL